MTTEERVDKCVFQCMEKARAKIDQEELSLEEKQHLAMYLPLCLSVAKLEDSFPELNKPQGSN